MRIRTRSVPHTSISPAIWGRAAARAREGGKEGVLYRLSHPVANWVLLTWIWDVPSSCLGSSYPLYWPTGRGNSSNLTNHGSPPDETPCTSFIFRLCVGLCSALSEDLLGQWQFSLKRLQRLVDGQCQSAISGARHCPLSFDEQCRRCLSAPWLAHPQRSTSGSRSARSSS